MSHCSNFRRAKGLPYPRTRQVCGLGPCHDPKYATPPAQHRTEAAMAAAMQALEQVFPGCAIVLLVAPFGAPKGARVNYVSNGQRDEIVTLMKEVIGRFEGRAHDAPAERQ